MTRSRAFAAASLVPLSAALARFAHAEPAAKMADGMLVNTAGMTLYTFDRDVAASGKSACNGPCAALWPPAMAAADAKADGDFTIVVARRRREAVGVQGQARVYLQRRQEGRRDDRRQLQGLVARHQVARAGASASTR